MQTQNKRTVRILILILTFALLAGCGGAATPAPAEALPQQPEALPGQTEQLPPTQPANVNVGGLMGPTGMALVGMAEDARTGRARHNYNVTFDSAPDVIQGKILSGELDIAALPTNLAALLYNRTEGEITMIAMSRLSVLFIMAAPEVEIHSLEDLRGRTLATGGQGGMQEYVLRFLLEEAGIDPENDLTIEFQTEHALVVAQMLDGRAEVALLPQPFVTTLITQNPEMTRALSIDDAWAAATGGAELAMSALVARTDFLEQNPQVVREFLEDYAASARFTAENVEEAAALIGAFEIIPEAVALQAIPHSNISAVTGPEMRDAAMAYLRVLYGQNPAAVGGVLPDETFFFLP